MEDSTKKNWFSEGIILALIPILGYFFAFQYEAGFASYFRYPKEFISIGLPQIVIATVILWTVAMVLFMFMEMITMMIPEKQRGLCDSIFRFLPLTGFFVGSLLAYGWTRAWPFLILFLWMSIPEFILPLFTQKDKKGYSEKIEADWNSEWKLRQTRNTLSWRLVRLFGHKHIIIVINIFLLAQLTHCIGEVSASRQIRFFTTSDVAEKVVLRIYDDKLICAFFDKSTKIVKSNIFVHRSTDQDIKSLKLEMLGPLKTEKMQSE